MTLPWFPPGSPEHRWMVEQVDTIVTGWESTRDATRWHDGYHRRDVGVEWRDPEPILGEPKPWHPGHRPHDPEGQ